MEYTEEDLDVSNENSIIRQKEFVLTSDKKNVFNAKLYITTNDLFCLDLVTIIDFQSKKYSISLTMNDLIKDRFFKIFIDLDEVFRELESKIENSNILEDTNQIYLDVPIGLNVINDIILEIKESNKSNEDIIEDLTNQINEQNILIKEKDIKIKELENKLNEYQNKSNENNEKLNSDILILKNTIQKNKEEFKLNELMSIDKLKILEKTNSEKDKQIENLNKKIENLNNELKNKENLINSLPNNCIKLFLFPKKIIYCLKVDAQIDISNYIDYNKKFNCDWFKPDSSEELNNIIEYFYNNHKIYDIGIGCWIITYGVETDPNEKKVGGYPIKTNGNGSREGDDNVSGKCNGTGFTAFRKGSSSFANSNYFKKLCNWDSSDKFSIICLQKNI